MLVFDRLEVDKAIDSVDSTRDDFLIVEGTQFLLAVLLVDLQQFTDPLKSDLTVIERDDANIVLDQHSLQLIIVFLDIKR